MFIRVKTTPNSPRQSVQIVESVRVGDKIKQKIVRYVGIAMNDQELERLKDAAAHIMVSLGEAQQPSLLPSQDHAEAIIAARKKAEEEKREEDELPVKLKNLREESRATVGFHEVYGTVFDDLGFNRLLGANRDGSSKVLRDIVMARLAQPASKLATSKLLEKDFGIDINVNKIYRMMDFIDAKCIRRINSLSAKNAFGLLQDKVDVMFYDCTTLYFESFNEDDLRQKGFSKDHKNQETQVLLALLVTSHGLPISYRLYPGATWEGHTLKFALDDIAQFASIAKVVVVADSGLFCKENLAMMENQEFIVASRLKSLPQVLANEITNIEKFQTLAEGVRYYETSHLGKRLIVTWSAERAAKDAHDREKSLQKILKRLHGKPCKSLINNAYGRYLKIEGEGRVSIDDEKIKQAARWDGLHGMITNVYDLSPSEILEQYHGLWQVEETFRLSKHDLSMRPMFHWTPRRIEAHVAICFIALTCLRHLQYHCALRYTKLSAEIIRQELAHVQVSTLRDSKSNRLYGMPSKLGVHTRKLYSLLGKKISTVPFEIFTL